MNRRLIILIIIVLAALSGVALVVLSLTRNNSEEVETQTQLSLKKVLDEQVISPVGAYNNNSLWYFNSEGRLFKANTDGSGISEYPLAELPGGQLRQVLWPKTGADFIAIYSGLEAEKQYYGSNNKFYVGLANNIKWIEWMPDGKRILYIWQADDKKSQQLALADADGSGFKTIASVFWPDLAIKASPSGKLALLYRTSIQGDTNKIYAVNIETGAMTTLVDSGLNTSAMWVSDSKFLFEQNSKIYSYDVATKQTLDLKLNTKLDKTALVSGSKTLYAAVPKSDSGFNFVKLNLDTNQLENYFEPAEKVNVKNLLTVGNTLYFTDNVESKLYMISQ